MWRARSCTIPAGDTVTPSRTSLGELLIAVRTSADTTALGDHPMPRSEIAFVFRKLRQYRDDKRRCDGDLRRKPFRRRDVPNRDLA